MKAYKVFKKDWTCRGFQYEVGKEYKIDGEPELCSIGFHACKKVSDCFSYYSFNPENKVAEVELLGDIAGQDGDKQCTNHIRIVRELLWGEMLELANTGKGCTGNGNSGNWNSGNWNSGNGNSGNGNSGNWNSGDWNSGDRNSGNGNSGNRNSGNWNSGDRNSGNGNSGNWNSGDWNSGDWNSGNWNSGDGNSGLFNTTEPFVRMFNKDTGITRADIDIPGFMYCDLTKWVSHDTATDEEKEEHKQDIETCGGFLKTIEYKEAFKRAWNNASEEEHELVKALPNFDTDIFFEISGIRV